MEKQPFTPTPEPEMPQYVQSISDRRARNQDGTFISNEAVQNAHETYDTEKAAYDEQEADRLRVYENAATIPRDTDLTALTASDLQKQLGISYKQALELQSNGGSELIQSAWAEADAKKAEAESIETDDKSENKNVFVGERDDKPAENLPEENDGLLEELPEFVKETVVRTPENQETPDTRIELSAKQMDTVLRQLVKDYRKADKNAATSEELGDYRTKILSAFNALKVKDGWTDAETDERRERLISLLGDTEKVEEAQTDAAVEAKEEVESTTPEQDKPIAAEKFNPNLDQAVLDKIDAEAAEGKVEELVAVDAQGNKLDKKATMDALVSKMGGTKAEHSTGTLQAPAETDKAFSQDAMDEYMNTDFDNAVAAEPREGVFKRLFGRFGRRNNRPAPKGIRPTTGQNVKTSTKARINAEQAGSDKKIA